MFIQSDLNALRGKKKKSGLRARLGFKRPLLSNSFHSFTVQSLEVFKNVYLISKMLNLGGQKSAKFHVHVLLVDE